MNRHRLFIQEITKLVHTKSSLQDNPSNNKILFNFTYSKEDAVHNANVLDCYNFDLELALLAQQNTQLSYGSEFKKSSDLQKLLGNHPLWLHTSKILDNGATFPLHYIDPETRSTDNAFHLDRGNHKSATKFHDILKDIIQDDVSKGYALILPIQILKHLINPSIAPLGCHQQETINEKGERVPKFRMTHDQTFPGPSGLSVNNRVIKESLPPSNVYGYTLKCILHYIVSLRNRHPTTKIHLSKFDFDAAYRRCHLSTQSALESLTIFDDHLFLALRLEYYS